MLQYIRQQQPQQQEQQQPQQPQIESMKVEGMHVFGKMSAPLRWGEVVPLWYTNTHKGTNTSITTNKIKSANKHTTNTHITC